MSAQIRSGNSTDLLTVDPISKAARVTLYKPDGTEVFPAALPVAYRISSYVMSLGVLAAGSCIFSLANPTGSGKEIQITRAMANLAFSGTAAATFAAFGMMRATGTAAGGTASKSGASISKRLPSSANSIALITYGPAVVTGLTQDAAGQVRSIILPHQNGVCLDMDLLGNVPHTEADTDATIIVPGTAWSAWVANATIAGDLLALNVEWLEK